MGKLAGILLSGLTILALAGCSDTKISSQTASGLELFNDICAECHKRSGSGDFLKGIPANASTILNKKEISTLIREGRSDKPEMPVFSNLTEDQAGKIAEHLLSLNSGKNTD